VTRCAVASTLLALITAAAPALAQTKQECADAYTAAQVSRKESKLVDARDKLTVCANASCPAALRKDCVPWLAEVEAALPTVAVKPVDETGRVVVGATVTIDGHAIAREGEYATTRLDPGEHVIRVEAPGTNGGEERVTLAAGSSRREIVVRVKRAGPVVTAPPPSEPPAEASRPIPTATFVLAGLGVAGVGAFAVLGAVGASKKGQLDQEGCKPNCKQSDVDAIKTDYIAADVALGVGGAALAGALIVFLARPSAPKNDAAFGIAPARGGAALFVRF
jgi:hypothetical protein